MSARLQALWAAALALLATAADSLACAVCFGQSDSAFVKGTEMSVLFMVIVTYFVIGGGVATFIVLRRRQRRQDSDSA